MLGAASRHPALAVRGKLDLATVEALTSTVDEARSGGAGRVVIDLASLAFVDCCGLRALARLDESAWESGGELAIRPGPPVVDRLFDLTGTRPLFLWSRA